MNSGLNDNRYSSNIDINNVKLEVGDLVMLKDYEEQLIVVSVDEKNHRYSGMINNKDQVVIFNQTDIEKFAKRHR